MHWRARSFWRPTQKRSRPAPGPPSARGKKPKAKAKATTTTTIYGYEATLSALEQLIRGSGSTTMKAAVLSIPFLTFVLPKVVKSSEYSNVTLRSGELSVVVYLPATLSGNEDTFYRSSRFEHGSMIGSIQRTTTETVISSTPNEAGVFEKKVKVHTHELYGTELWRTPHNPYWPESGVGLASEFGVGDDGANCDYRCGWNGVNDVTNGVLGYKEANIGQSFLKIGVGELIKGSCPECDFTGIFKFNSPYQFAKQPEWKKSQPNDNVVILEHEAKLNQYGYRLVKTIVLENNVLSVTSTLTNLGIDEFRTVWYSHHFFDCDAEPIGPGYSLELDLKESRPQLFEEPGNSGWTVPLRNYARVTQHNDHIDVTLKRNVEIGARIKAEFLKDEHSRGGFTMHGCGVNVREDIAEVQTDSQAPLSMYGFNLYIEASTLSPEPQLLIHLERGATTSWTQRLVFEDDATNSMALEEEAPVPTETFSLKSIGSSMVPSRRVEAGNVVGGLVVLVTAICFVALMIRGRWSRRRRSYTRIEDT